VNKISDLERRAVELLEKYGHGKPPIDVVRLCQQLNIELAVEELEDEISGVLMVQEQPVIVVNRSHSRARQRFTIAHEIGHFVLHRTPKDAVFVDRAALQFRNQVSSKGLDPNEVAANHFAAALLMPHSMLEADLRSIDESITAVHVIRLAKKYGVSEQAMNIRLARLDFVSYI
jgi:Zn-dependent peptidase ImmA (M78 family)